jgi:hypothetical protein
MRASRLLTGLHVIGFRAEACSSFALPEPVAQEDFDAARYEKMIEQ